MSESKSSRKEFNEPAPTAIQEAKTQEGSNESSKIPALPIKTKRLYRFNNNNRSPNAVRTKLSIKTQLGSYMTVPLNDMSMYCEDESDEDNHFIETPESLLDSLDAYFSTPPCTPMLKQTKKQFI
jgi:hypothetical protein